MGVWGSEPAGKNVKNDKREGNEEAVSVENSSDSTRKRSCLDAFLYGFSREESYGGERGQSQSRRHQRPMRHDVRRTLSCLLVFACEADIILTVGLEDCRWTTPVSQVRLRLADH